MHVRLDAPQLTCPPPGTLSTALSPRRGPQGAGSAPAAQPPANPVLIPAPMRGETRGGGLQTEQAFRFLSLGQINKNRT